MCFDEVAATNRSYLCRLARKFRVPEHEIEDLVQDTLLMGHKKWSTFEHRSRPGVWLCGIMLNLLLNRRRKWSNDARKREAYGTFTEQRATSAVESFIEPHELEEFVASLDPPTREVFVKCELEGYKGREVAEALAVKPGTAATWLRNARLELRRRFKPNGYWSVVGALFPPRRGASPWSFAKGFACAAAVVAAVSVNLPFDRGLAEGRSSSATVNEPAKEDPPRATVESPPHVEAPPPSLHEVKHEGPDRRSRARNPSKRPRASKPTESDVERLYYARRIRGLKAPTCARASLEASMLPVRMHALTLRDPPLDSTHVLSPGKLLESACQHIYPGR